MTFLLYKLQKDGRGHRAPRTPHLRPPVLTVSRLGALGRGLHTAEQPSPNGKSGDPKSGIWNPESVTLEAKCSGHSCVKEGSPSELKKNPRDFDKVEHQLNF